MADDTKSLTFPFLDLKTAHGSDGPSFEGLLATWELDLGGDIIEPGAFKRTLRHWRSKAGRVIPLLDMHDRHSSVTTAVGKLVDAEERKEGLWTKWDMVPDDERAGAVHRRLAGGFVDGMSIGYRPVKFITPSPQEQQAGVFRRIKEVHLREGSVVLFPMNEDTRVDESSVKGLLEGMGLTITVDAGNVVDTSRLLELSAKAELDDTETEERNALLLKFGASPPKPSGDGEGLSPDDPKRLGIDRTLRDIRLRGLTTRPRG